MSIEQIKATTAKALHVNEEAIELDHRLMGGMSNFTYVIKVNEDKYTFRIPGKNAERFVDRDVENDHIPLSEQLGLNNETVYLDVHSGEKIARFIEGVPLSTLNPLDYLEQAATLLHTIHDSAIQSPHAYQPFERLEKYESYLNEYHHTHHERYIQAKATLLSNRDFLETFGTVFTHGDSQLSNFIVNGDILKLTDWEFSGMNDAFYDLACFGNNDFTHAESLLPVYLKKEPSTEDWNRLYLWRLFQTLQWHNVALYKHFIGLSEDLKIDFYKVSNLYLDKAESLIGKLK